MKVKSAIEFLAEAESTRAVEKLYHQAVESMEHAVKRGDTICIIYLPLDKQNRDAIVNRLQGEGYKVWKQTAVFHAVTALMTCRLGAEATYEEV